MLSFLLLWSLVQRDTKNNVGDLVKMQILIQKVWDTGRAKILYFLQVADPRTIYGKAEQQWFSALVSVHSPWGAVKAATPVLPCTTPEIPIYLAWTIRSMWKPPADFSVAWVVNSGLRQDPAVRHPTSSTVSSYRVHSLWLGNLSSMQTLYVDNYGSEALFTTSSVCLKLNVTPVEWMTMLPTWRISTFGSMAPMDTI